MNKVTVTFKDGSTRSIDQGATLHQIIQEINSKLSLRVIAATVDDQLVDLSFPIQKDAIIHFISGDDDDGIRVFWHSGSHIMAQAVKDLYPEAQLGIGPSISNGFYYDFHLSEPLNPQSLEDIEKKMSEIVEQNQTFEHEYLSRDKAIALFKKRNEPFKIELIEELKQDKISVYRNDSFVDLCRGPHIPSTGFLKHFKLLSIAGAYWRGDERNAVMQRVYGVAFPDAKSLKKYLNNIEEAKKRDHRRLGKALDLFSFQPEGPGFVFWHAKGAVLFNQIINYIREVLEKHGYHEIKTPIILNEELWHRSGHWDNYKENMYFTEIDEQKYAVKPMNCPGGLLVYKNSPHSYRDLPLKLSELGLVHRHEKSGVLHGLFRVRQFTQDDAHIYCTEEQIEDEIVELIDLINEVYTVFGFENFQIELSTRPAKAIGSAEMWKKAEKALAQALNKKNIQYQVNEGEGAFYGPKIDYHIQDSLGRMWQCGTIQVDFSMPERFDLDYIGPDGEKHRPVMIHRAIFGSLERFIGILIEHYGGAFPVWLAPVQCVICPISEKHHDYAESILLKLKETGIRCELDDRNEKIGYKIRESEVNKIPYMCIVGDQEVENQSVSVRVQGKGDQGAMPVEKFITDILEKIKRRAGH